MPLVRVEVRNEYGLGAPEMYREANKEEPKEVLEGVAVAGLVGVLRQLGDLADFAAEVFHGLQEEVMITSSRSHKLMGRVRQIEAALSPLEKAVQAQRSHLHFAYTAGSSWHPYIRCDKNHFVYSDVPQFIFDSYEDCRGPPHLHLLDRFDPGGPGSCLRRYSDPTFFKRASIASGEASTAKVSKYEKHKIKKRRPWRRNGEVSQGASFSYQSGRIQFTQINFGGHAAPSQSMSTCDATLRPDLSEQSNLDLRNGLNYSKGDFSQSYSMQPKEQESRDFISSPVKRNHSNCLDYNFLKEDEEDITDACDDIQINLTQGQGGCSSYSVDWDEQKAGLEPTMQDYNHYDMTHEGDRDRNMESFPRLDLETLGDDAVSLETVHKMAFQTCDQALPTFESGDNHPDDFESEKDHFLDALNNIEPESETDINCMRKQEVDHYSKLEDKAAEGGVPELIKHNLECRTSDSEFNFPANGSPINGVCGHNPLSMSPESPFAVLCSINRVPATDECNSIPSVDKALLSAQRVGKLLSPGSLQRNNSGGNGDFNESTNIESVSYEVSSCFGDGRSWVSIIGDTRNSPESRKPAAESSTVTSVTLWTNGGLLGLQPSKPPDCSVLNDFSQDHLYKKEGKISSSSQCIILSDEDLGRQDKTESLRDIAEGLDTDSSTGQEDQESGISFRKTSWKISPADLDIKLGITDDLLYPNNPSFTRANVTASGSSLPVNSEFQAARKNPENTRSSSRMFEISNRLLNTGSNKNLLHSEDENSRHAGYRIANAIEQKNHQNSACRKFSGRSKEVFEGESILLSPSSSPPLAHMKISFQPIDGFETSKLKLKFPDGSSNDESSRDFFPSFQLVPELYITQRNVGPDLDDDTLYRSSPSLSDECQSNQSESNSEQWETGESPSGKDPELYDSLCRISLKESVTTVLENGNACHGDIHENSGFQHRFVENIMGNPHSCFVDLQSFDTQNHSSQELRKDTNSRDLVEPEFVTTTDPPVQRQSLQQHPDGKEDRCELMPIGLNYALDLKHPASTNSQQPKLPLCNHDQIIETTIKQKRKQFSSQNSNNQGKSIDMKEDFLHQIRTKSFSLRPTVPVKPTIQPGGSSNVQVTAILEKANAIRQAVGSDDGDDDGDWGHT